MGPSFKLPEHVAFYDDSTLARLFGDAAFTDLQAIFHPHAFSLQEILGKLGWRTLGRWIPRWLVIPGAVIAWAGRVQRNPVD